MKGKVISFFSIFLLVSILLFSASSSTLAADSAGLKVLKKKLTRLINNQKNTSKKFKNFTKTTLIQQTYNSVFAKAIKAQNAEKIPMDVIMKHDNDWMYAEEELPIHRKMLNNPCADEVRRLAKKNPAIRETFVMDNRGANVCQNALTSDYFQGDEKKWKDSFNKGKGGIDVDDEKMDKSTNELLQRITLPLTDSSGKVIGAISYGIRTGSL